MCWNAIKMSRLRIFWPSVNNMKVNMSTNSLSKNHYETLELKQSATHNEIKSAYYKLTMQYHPDKNKSDFAKEKFRNVAEAYEVLGNQHSRKAYDRKITVRKTGLSPQRGPVIIKPPTMNIYKTRMATNTDASNMFDTGYNYEEWIRARYTANFRRRQQATGRLGNMIHEEDKKSPSMLIGCTIFGIMFVILLCLQTTSNYDVPAHSSKTKSSLKNTENGSIGKD
ncbi:dnaJ homolog subfamily C member 30 [Cephus cinctus]|uniref:DnaJ homolog subfamily C member 30 n=1 Tax=Cephus cinctus TaxID=211228 RepID=A0AAJ7FI26_CEPCN|nr:dnaJ homolog subfamily C member 30 [Cephus cinctus]